MKTPYDFESRTPPRLTEAALRAEQRRRQLRRQTALAALASVLLQTAMLLLGALLLESSPLLGAVCLGYAIVSAAGGSLMALALSGREEFSL